MIVFADIIQKAEGVFENDNFFLNPVSKIKLKDACEYKIFLRIQDDKVYIYPFQNHPYTTFSSREHECTAEQLARYIYKSSYYSTKFKALTYSLNDDNLVEPFNPNVLINVYSLKDFPRSYYKFSEDGFDNLRILSHLLYRHELNNYISGLEKNSTMDMDSE